MILQLLLSTAFALPPDGLGALLPVGSGKLSSMDVSFDGDVVTGIDGGDKKAWLLHVEDWSLHDVAPCTVRSTTYIGYEDQFGEVWVGCGDGTLRGQAWDPINGTLTDVVDADGNPITIDLGEPADGLWYSATNGLIYALSEQDNAPPVLHAVDPFNIAVDATSPYPLQMQSHIGFNEGVLLFDDNTLVVSHGGQQMSTVGLYSGAVIPSVAQGSVLAPLDLYPSWNGGAYGVASNGTLADYINSQWTFQLTGLNAPEGVIASLDPVDPWIAVTGGDVRVWRLDSDTGQIEGTADTPYFQSIPDPDLEQNFIQDGVTSDGYLWGGGVAGFLHVATARPWVDPGSVTVTPSAATAGDVVTIGFTVDEAGDWEVRRGGSRDADGILLDQGTIDGAGSIEIEATVANGWDEGINGIYVFLLDNQNQLGHARGELLVDNPPDPPVLAKSDLQFGDRKLTLAFDGIDDTDLAEYEVYVTTTDFDPAAFESGGPEYDGNTRLTTPIVVAGTPSARVTVDIQPLKNDVKHFVAVRAVDQGGLVGPMSNVISGTPRPTYAASDLAGEEGGPACATAPGPAGLGAILIAGLAAFRRRGRRLAPLLALGLLPSVAVAQDSDKKKGLEKDLTPQRGNFEARYGGIFLQDDDIKDIYRDGQNNILQVEFGPQVGRILELDMGVGFFQELAFKVDANGNQSSERTMLTWWPALSLDGTARLHIVDEQIVVPYIRAGFDWVVWSEKTDQGTGKDVLRGAKFGNHLGLGGSLLLDVFDKKRASLLEAQSGINDTYLTFEWRRQRVDDRNLPWAPAKNTGFDFSATMFTVGLKLDY